MYVVPLERFNHNLTHLLRKYRAEVKQEKPIIKDIKLLDVRSEEMLQDCLDYTDW